MGLHFPVTMKATVVARGTVSDFGPTKKGQVKAAFAETIGISPNSCRLSVLSSLFEELATVAEHALAAGDEGAAAAAPAARRGDGHVRTRERGGGHGTHALHPGARPGPKNERSSELFFSSRRRVQTQNRESEVKLEFTILAANPPSEMQLESTIKHSLDSPASASARLGINAKTEPDVKGTPGILPEAQGLEGVDTNPIAYHYDYSDDVITTAPHVDTTHSPIHSIASAQTARSPAAARSRGPSVTAAAASLAVGLAGMGVLRLSPRL